MSGKQIIRDPVVAGMFYDGSASVLREKIEGYLKDAEIPDVGGKVRAIVSPHAGYMYSGLTAAHAYKIIRGHKYECVVVIGPSHREYFDGISVYPGDMYRTPLGNVAVNKEIRSQLVDSCKLIIEANEGHRSEHSIEVQLPFLQYVLGEFSFIPIIMGDQRRELCDALSKALVDVAKKHDILFVASSDLSHYHPADEAIILDKRVIHELENFNADTFIDKLEGGAFEACGGGPVAVIMKTARELGAGKTEILNYRDSGDITGDKKAVVGYLAAAFL
jgi:AmmeMemoRadiSam system protein B